MKKKILIFVSEDRGYNEICNVVKELSKSECDYVFIYPIKGNFTYESNVDYNAYENFESKTIGFTLPFKPDILLITKESWLPETNLIIEFKQAGTIVCNLENSSWLYNNIKTRLEIISRMKFPTNMIDVFFDHSEWVYETKIKAGWINNKSIITGIPKFDLLKETNTEDIIQKYNITKPIIILYGSMESNIRCNILNIAEEIKNKYNNDYHLFYKPHPKEFIDYFDSFNNGVLTSFTVIQDEKEMFSFAKLGNIHIGIISSIMYYPLYFNKSIYYIDSDDSGVLFDMDFNNFKGQEYAFWAPIINVRSWNEFVNKIGENRINEFKERYEYFINKYKNTLKSYKNSLDLEEYSYNNDILLSFYDEFNDGNASKRIVNYLINLYV
jgi:hypothetical protein